MADFPHPDPASDLKQARRRTRREPVPLPAPLDGRDIRCSFCPGRSFRRSRLRGRDIGEILRMRYPVRCLRCSQRQYVSFTVAGLSLSSQIKHSRPARQMETWKSYTSGTAPAFPGATPAYIADAPPPADGAAAGEAAGEHPLTDPKAAAPGAPVPARSDPDNNEIW